MNDIYNKYLSKTFRNKKIYNSLLLSKDLFDINLKYEMTNQIIPPVINIPFNFRYYSLLKNKPDTTFYQLLINKLNLPCKETILGYLVPIEMMRINVSDRVKSMMPCLETNDLGNFDYSLWNELNLPNITELVELERKTPWFYPFGNCDTFYGVMFYLLHNDILEDLSKLQIIESKKKTGKMRIIIYRMIIGLERIRDSVLKNIIL